MPDSAKDAKKDQREKRELRKKIERSAAFRHLKEQLTQEDNCLLDSMKDLSVDPKMEGMLAKNVSEKLDDLGKQYKIEQHDLTVLKQLALLYRFYPSIFLEKCDCIEQCFHAGVDPFELIDLGELHMEFAMSFLYEIRTMLRGVYLAKKRKLASQKSKDDRRFSKVYFRYIERKVKEKGKNTLEKLLKKEFPERIAKNKEVESYNALKSAYYRAIKRIGVNRELSLEDLLYFFWDKTALLFRYDTSGDLLKMPWRVTLTSSKTRSNYGVIRDYILGINAGKIKETIELRRRTPYDGMWNNFSKKADTGM